MKGEVTSLKITEYSAYTRMRSRPCVVALGLFDGVHLAHRALIGKAVAEARALGTDALVFTFRSESAELKRGVGRLYPTEDKLSLIASLGVDETVVADFSELSHMSPEEFVSSCLVGSLDACVAVCGFNFRFGYRSAADAHELSRLLAEHGRRTIISEEYSFEGKTLSASLIRSLIGERRLKEASRALGEPYFISAVVEGGISLGGKLGTPTANTPIDEKRIALPRGVYRTRAEIRGEKYNAVTNIGVCPTVGARALHAETHILGFSGVLYGERVKISFLEFLRDEMEFASEEELKMQINIDKMKALNAKDDN
ncbi:MAG: riboflavin biosynthesis protein RibF [Clostridia bacterium]|nr:riboflavin biosynthesis protein RibF [Clostridia bacterium]